MRRLDIGIASFRSPEKLRKTVQQVQRHSVTDWRLIITHNSGNDEAYQVIKDAQASDSRITVQVPGADFNVGYAGAVNTLFASAETEYIAYLDNDAYVETVGWDEALCSYLDRFHSLGIVFPGHGHYPVNNGQYTECLWAAGFCWVTSRMAQRAVGPFNTEIGHHEEVNWCRRLRIAGYQIACVPEVTVTHDETSSRSPESLERINAGIVRWMDTELAYFCGKNVNYHSENVLRVLDWNTNALHMEKYFKSKLPGLNASPETVVIDGTEWDLIKVPRPKGFYGGRII